MLWLAHPPLGSARAWLVGGGVPQHAERIVQECAAGLVTVRRGADTLSFAAPPRVRAAAIDQRLGYAGTPAPRVLAASVAAAVRVALQQWLQPAAAPLTTGGLVVPSGSLPDLLRFALAILEPALDAAEEQAQQRLRQ